LSKYRQLTRQLGGADFSSKIQAPGDDLQSAVVQDWLNEFERIQHLLRLSPGLRQKHGD